MTGAGTYSHGQNCTLTATAATGYAFTNWTKNGTVVSTNPSFSFNVTENAAYVANFSQNSYTITATANPTAGGSVTGAGTYGHGQSCTLTATAATGYAFTNWTKGGTVVSTNPTFSFTVTESAAYVANFALVGYEIIATASPISGGTVTGGGVFNLNQTCTLTATANPSYAFANWTKDGVVVSTDPTYTFTVESSGTYIAHFSPLYYMVSVVASPAQSGIVSGGGMYRHGATCTLNATAHDGFVFAGWTKNGVSVSTDPVYTFTVTENVGYVALFIADTYEIKAKTDPENTGVITGIGFYDYGATCTLTVTPNDDYEFVHWTLNGEVVSESESLSFVVTQESSYIAHLQPYDAVGEASSITAEIYPNPTINTLKVEVSEPVRLMEIFNSLGDLVYKSTSVSDENLIDVSGWAPGTYTLRMTTGNGVVSKKFVKGS